MRYQTKKVTREVEVLELTPLEYERIDDFYKEALLSDNIPFPVVKNCNLNKIILTNGIYRKEFMLEVNADSPIKEADREADAKERRLYLQSLEENETDVEKEYGEMMKIDSVPDPLAEQK